MNTHERSEARAVAVRAFKWILSAYQPLKLSELSYAAAIRDDGALDSEVDDDFVLDVCSNFVTIDTSERTQFVHASVREFLEDLEIDDSKVYSARSVHTQAAKTCLIYLTSRMFLSAPEIVLNTGFPEYARHFWARHCKSCEVNRKEDKVLWKSFLDFMSLREVHPGFRRWHGCLKNVQSFSKYRVQRLLSEIQLYYNDGGTQNFGTREEDCLAREPNPFLVACVFGFLDVVEKQPTEAQAMLNSQNSSSRSGLILACRYGHPDMAFMLLEKRASVDTKDNSGSTPLHHAVGRKSEALVRMLLEAGADTESEDALCVRPLWWAVHIGSLPIVQMLLDYKANPHIRYRRTTCLKIAIKVHQGGIARLLWEAGARIRPSDPQRLTSSLTRYKSAPALFSLAKQDGRTEDDHGYQYKESGKLKRRLDPQRASDDIPVLYHTPNSVQE